MKKLFFSLFAIGLLTFSQVSASTYKVNESALSAAFAQADDVSITAAAEAFQLMYPDQAKVAGDKTVGGFLLRAYFCGGFALHRYYMGTGGTPFFWYYFCIPVVGGLTACIDFWYVVFKGKEGLDKFADNPKFWVWN